MIETEKGKRIEQILATDVTREQLAEALWCAESSQRMWHGCAEENRSFRLKAEAENAKLRELVRHLYEYRQLYFKTGIYPTDHGVTEQRMRELGVD